MCVAYNFNIGLWFVLKLLPANGFPCRNPKQLNERCWHDGCSLSILHAGCFWPGIPTLKELSWPSWLELRLRTQQFGHKMSPAAHISAAIWQQCSTAHFVSQTAGSVAWIINNNYLHVAPSNNHNKQADPCLTACRGWGHFFLDQLHPTSREDEDELRFSALQRSPDCKCCCYCATVVHCSSNKTPAMQDACLFLHSSHSLTPQVEAMFRHEAQRNGNNQNPSGLNQLRRISSSVSALLDLLTVNHFWKIISRL